jgi:hypothetical protein
VLILLSPFHTFNSYDALGNTNKPSADVNPWLEGMPNQDPFACIKGMPVHIEFRSLCRHSFIFTIPRHHLILTSMALLEHKWRFNCGHLGA